MRELRNILFQKGLRWLCTGPLKFYMQQQILNIIFVFASISYTHAQLLFPCSFSAVNHHNNKNWVPSILAHNLWLIFTGMKQKKKSKWPTQKNWVLQLLQFSILFSQISYIGLGFVGLNDAKGIDVAQPVWPYKLSHINALRIIQFYQPKDQFTKFLKKNAENWLSWKT